MDIWKFIMPDRMVLALFLLLFLLSLVVSEFFQGYPGNVNCNYCNSQCGGCGMSGFGVPFMWYNVITTCGEGVSYHLSGGRAPPMCAAASLVTQFEPVSFILNIIIFYVAAFMLVRGYDYFFKKKK